MVKLSKIYLIMAIVFSIIFCTWSTVRIVNAVSFDVNCTSYIKRAADANTVEMAKEELSKAIKYAEDNDLTDGIVSIFLKDPQNDIGFWYENMKASHAELESLPEDSTALEKTNVLMKLRESMTDNEENGIDVTVPNGISIYPHNVIYFWWGTLSGILTCFFWTMLFIEWMRKLYL